MIQVTTPVSVKSETDDNATESPMDGKMEVCRGCIAKEFLLLLSLIMQATTPASLKSEANDDTVDSPVYFKWKEVKDIYHNFFTVYECFNNSGDHFFITEIRH